MKEQDDLKERKGRNTMRERDRERERERERERKSKEIREPCQKQFQHYGKEKNES